MQPHLFFVVTLASLLAPLYAQTTQAPTPAQQKIQSAQAAVNENPDQYHGHNALAMALALRARETADPDYYEQADQALEASLRLAPDNYQARKVKAWVLLGQHEFAKGLELARKLNREAPDDVMVYGFLVDAYVELGQYDKAEEAAQWMLDLRPGNVPGLTRAAYLRELFGDIDGSVELLTMAYQSIPGHESEHRAWVLTHIGQLYLATGRVDLASQLFEQALETFPDYHYALAGLAHTRTVQGQHEAALALFEKHYEVAPHPENLYLVGQALDRLGRADKARAAYEAFEDGAAGEMDCPDNANRDLIFYYTDHADRPEDALRVAQLEITRRGDVYTLDAHAWALYANGRYDEARQQIDAALAVGIRDAKCFYHAGVIATKQGDRDAAQRYFKDAIALNPSSQWAQAADKALATVVSVDDEPSQPHDS